MPLTGSEIKSNLLDLLFQYDDYWYDRHYYFSPLYYSPLSIRRYTYTDYLPNPYYWTSFPNNYWTRYKGYCYDYHDYPYYRRRLYEYPYTYRYGYGRYVSVL